MTEDTYTMHEIVRSLRRIESKVDAQSDGLISRAEFGLHKEAIGREIGELKEEIKSRRAPWWVVVPIIFTSVMLAIAVIPLLSR